jgi:integrase
MQGPDGREHMEHGGTKSDARALYMRRRTEIHDGTWKSPRERRAARRKAIEPSTAEEPLTLGAFADAWLEERTPHITKAVHYDYKLLLKTRVHGHEVARKPIAEVNDGDVSLLIKDLTEHKTRRKKPLSPRRINMVIARLRTIFAAAHRRKLIADDPMPHVANLREPKHDVDPFDLAEALRIIDAAEGWERGFLSVLLFTGMRPNEALALSWDSIDFEHRLIRIRRTLNRRYGFGLPKTPGSERDVEMSSVVRAELQEQRARSQLRGKLVFPSEAGTAIDLSNFRTRRWPKILSTGKVRARVIYQCRHTFARLALEQGDTPQHVSAMLGHTTLEMLFRVYSRWMGGPESSALARLDAAIRANSSHGSGVKSGENQ